MIKSAQNYILPSLKLLFNKILICGFYPKIGLRVIILLFFKSDNKDDPNRYDRGITVAGRLCKLFNTILISGLISTYEIINQLIIVKLDFA